MSGIVCFGFLLVLVILVCPSGSSVGKVTQDEEDQELEVPADILNTSGCKCANSKCQDLGQDVSKNSTNLSMLEKLLTFLHRHHFIHKRNLRQKRKPMDRKKRSVQTYGSEKLCKCINSKCRCAHKLEGPEPSPAVKELLARLYLKNDEILREEEMLQESVKRFR